MGVITSVVCNDATINVMDKETQPHIKLLSEMFEDPYAVRPKIPILSQPV